MQSGHARLPDGIHARIVLLRLGDVFVAELADQAFGICPGLVVGFAHDDVQAHAKLQLSPMGGGAATDVGELFGHGLGWLAPGEVGVDLAAGQLMRGI
ncbi:hypothetical protein SDC9_172047 [bioreactor metagenome]|uniref:Uncharacterized protein n=1 Tax=bioreactor metagenome TaxID=1076179 RepID=A0A645GD89_9ZZZZ